MNIIKNHNLSNGWTMTTELIQLHRIGEVESAIEYQVFDPAGVAIKSVSEMDNTMPDETDDELNDILRAITKSETPENKHKLNTYMTGTFANQLIKRGSVYNTKNAYGRIDNEQQ